MTSLLIFSEHLFLPPVAPGEGYRQRCQPPVRVVGCHVDDPPGRARAQWGNPYTDPHTFGRRAR
jgi:hypothetical protein